MGTKGVSASPNFLGKMFSGPRADKIKKQKNVALHFTAGIKRPLHYLTVSKYEGAKTPNPTLGF
jgi:hypothetical protein